MKLVASCGAAAAFLDAFTTLLDVALLWRLRCDPSAEDGDELLDGDACVAIARFALLFALATAHHGAVSWACAARARALLPILNPVSSGAVQL